MKQTIRYQIYTISDYVLLDRNINKKPEIPYTLVLKYTSTQIHFMSIFLSDKIRDVSLLNSYWSSSVKILVQRNCVNVCEVYR